MSESKIYTYYVNRKSFNVLLPTYRSLILKSFTFIVLTLLTHCNFNLLVFIEIYGLSCHFTTTFNFEQHYDSNEY